MGSRLFLWYSNKLKANPVLVNVVSGFAIASAGDVAAQVFEQRYRTADDVQSSPPTAAPAPAPALDLDLRRTLNLGVIRCAVIAPFISVWYPFLARTFSSTLQKVVFDQAFGSPFVISAVFLSNEILSGSAAAPSWDGFASKFLTDGLSAWRLGLCYWPIVHSITFGLLPLRHQPLWAHCASVPWNATLSFFANKRADAI